MPMWKLVKCCQGYDIIILGHIAKSTGMGYLDFGIENALIIPMCCQLTSRTFSKEQ